MRTKRAVTAIVAIGIIAAACGGSSASMSVDNAWARPTAPSAQNAAFYMTITGGDEADTLVSASSDVCGVTEVHETMMTDGAMSMAPVQGGVPVPADESVLLGPGGFHIMCLGITEPLELDDQVGVDLSFGSGESIEVTVTVSDEGDDLGSDS